MSKIFPIIQREFIERVRTKAFLIGTLVGPLIFFLVGKMPGWIAGAPTGSQTVAVIDATTDQVAGRLLDSLSRATLVSESGPIPRYSFVSISAEPPSTFTWPT